MPYPADFLLPAPANPGAAATAIVLDTTLGKNVRGGVTLAVRGARLDIRRVDVCVTVDQSATFFTDWLDPSSTTWRTFNGGGAGEPIAANTQFQRSVKRLGVDLRIRIVTVNNPSVWEVMAVATLDPALSQ